nr:MAG: hypothetical protein J07AB56_03550 [Candidatus Nanosalinarum sp. J07AB56]
MSSADDSATGTLTVLAVEVNSIDIAGQGADATIDEGTGPISVNGTLENFNTVDEDRDVTVTIANDTGTVLTDTISGFGLQVGEVRPAEFSGLAVGDLAADVYTVTVATPQTNATGQIEIAPTNAQINSVEFDDGDSASDTATILGSFLNTATDVVSSIGVDFGNVAGNVGLGNVGAGNVQVEIGNTDRTVSSVDNSSGELDIELASDVDLSTVDDGANINITVDNIDTTEATPTGNVSVEFKDGNDNTVTQNETSVTRLSAVPLGS